MSSEYHQRAIEQEEEFARLQLAFEHELRTDPRYQQYLAGYEPASAERFVKHYAAHKIHCLREGPGMVKFRLHQAIEHQEDAYERLFEIQQKKLFDLQVRWRAGEIELPGIVIHEQFRRWERYLHACPWLPPITVAEYELYRAYLASPACQDVGHHPDYPHSHDWQEYDMMRDDWRRTQPDLPEDETLDCTPYPAWYAYYDAHLGRPAGYPFATHPDHKGERQTYYCNLAWNDQVATEGPSAPYVPDRRPFYSGNHPKRSFEDHPGLYIDQYTEKFATFARAFEADPEPLIAYFCAYLRLQNQNHCHTMERTASSLEQLWDAKGPWPVAANTDWRLGIVLAAQELHRALLLAALPAVFEEYQFRLATGLAPAAPDKYRAYHDTDKPDNMEEKCAPPPAWVELILRGRELAGEPRDFAY